MKFFRLKRLRWPKLSAIKRAIRPKIRRLPRHHNEAGFGSNPGGLRMLTHARPRLPAKRPLVVVLHGCAQQATAFARASGWLALADAWNFALLMPEQVSANNRGLCFNWFRPGDVRRGGGEAMSIRQMIRAATLQHGSDPRRIFVVGFSAGGAMAVAMLAAYPNVFAGGGVVAGLPAGTAASPIVATMRMRRADARRSPAMLAADVRAVTGAASRKTWPRLSVWTGDDDQTVDPANAELIAAQWGHLHGFDVIPHTDSATPQARRRRWGMSDSRPAIELWTIPGLGHGFPITAASPATGYPTAFVVECGVSAAHEIAVFWNLDE